MVNFTENIEVNSSDQNLETSESVQNDENLESVEDIEEIESTEDPSAVIYVQEPAPDYTEILNDISTTLTEISESDDTYLSTYSIDVGGDMNAYFFSYGSDKVYIPYDKISYFAETESGELINISSSTITCYAVASDGTTGSTYRFPSFGTAQKYVASGNSHTWTSIDVYAADSNLVLGQTGINNFRDLLLFGILVLLGIIVFVKGKK